MASYPSGSPEALAKEGYDAHAQRYLDWTLSRHHSREPNLQRLLAQLEDASASSVLELGCGAGIPATKMLASACGRVVANDISTTQLALAREHLGAELLASGRVELVEASMLGLDFPAASFDAVVALYSLVHLEPADQRRMLARIRRWLRPRRGLVLLNLSTEAAPDGMLMEGWLGMRAAYVSSLGHEANLRMFEDSGFEVLNVDITKDTDDASFAWFLARAGP